MKKFLRREEGFTLIELLVVVAVLGILAALAIPRLTGVTDRARLAEAEQAIGSLKTGAEMCFVERNSYASLASTNLLDPSSTSTIGEYIDLSSLPANWEYSIEATDTTFTIKAVGTGVNANLGASINQDNEIYITRNASDPNSWQRK